MAHSRHYQIEEQSKNLDYKFIIFDIHNNLIYTICSISDEFDDKLILNDSSGHQLIKICQKDPHLHLTYNIYTNDDKEKCLAIIQRTGLPWHHKFKIESIYGEYTIDRIHGICSHEYILLKDKNKIAHINRTCPESDESYSVNIDENVDKNEDLFILSLVIVFWCAKRVHYLGQSEHN